MNLSKKVLAVVLHIAVLGISSQSLANREDFNKPSKELADSIAMAATTLGYDLSSKDGRKQFGDYMKSQRDTLATSLGIDLSTEEGRQKFKEAIKTHIDEVAKAQSIDLKTKEGRDALQKFLVSSGKYAYVRPEHNEKYAPREKVKDGSQEQNGDKNFAGGMKESCSNDQTSSQGSERRGPPPPREQRQEASQANGNVQSQRPDQRQ